MADVSSLCFFDPKIFPQHQNLNIPYGMKNYITQNWTPSLYQKLIQTCRYFFTKYQIVVIDGKDFKWMFNIENNQLVVNNSRVPLSKVWLIGRAILVYDEQIISFTTLVESAYCLNIYGFSIRNQNFPITAYMKISPRLEILALRNSKIIVSENKWLTTGDIIALTPNATIVN